MEVYLCIVPNVGVVGADVTGLQRHPGTDVLKAGCSKHTEKGAMRLPHKVFIDTI